MVFGMQVLIILSLLKNALKKAEIEPFSIKAIYCKL